MKKLVFALLLLSASAASHGQATIKLDEAKAKVGDSVQVCGKVFSARFLENSNGKPTLVNLGGAYPNELLTVVILGPDRDKFKDKPEEAWKDKTVCITGRITDYRGKPQIVITMPEQVKVQ
jgi:hypothetical protein